MKLLNKFAAGRKLTVVLAILVSLGVFLAACRTEPDDPLDAHVPEAVPPAEQPRVTAIEPGEPDPVTPGAPEWHDYRDDAKFDAGLRARLEQLDEWNGEDTLQVLIELRDAFSEEIHEHMQTMGLRLYTTEGYVIAAEGTPDALRTMTAFDYVVSISLSHNRGGH